MFVFEMNGGNKMEVLIVLTDTGTIFTKMIKMFTKQPLNHASIAFSKELDHTYSFGRKNANNPFIGGFVRENMKGKLFRRATCAIYSCSIAEEDYKQMLTFIHHIEKQQDEYKYNLLGLFGVLMNKKMNDKKAYFCSEFVATVLNNGGFINYGKPPCFVKPGDLVKYDGFSLKYEGRLLSYLEQQNQKEGEMTDVAERKGRRSINLDFYLRKAKSIAS